MDDMRFMPESVDAAPRGKRMIAIRGLDKSYQSGRQTTRVLEDLSIDVGDGEFVALMGPSGSGKTTLLNIISGLDAPDRGEVVVAGQTIDRSTIGRLARWRNRTVGFVFQSANLIAALNVGQNVEAPLFLTHLTARQRKSQVQRALSLVGLEGLERRRTFELSGGQQQRAAIARAIASDPMLLACDEPTGDLDRASADRVLDLLSSLNRDLGKTIVMVTHDPQAAAVAGRTIVLDKGRLRDAADPA